MAPGGSAELIFRLRSPSGEDKILPSFGDFDLDQDGNPVAGKVVSRSCASWGRLDRNELTLRPGGNAELRVRLETPLDARGTYWCLLRLETKGSPLPRIRGDVVQVLPALSVPLLLDVGRGAAPPISARFEATERQGSMLSSSVLLEDMGIFAAHLTGSVALEETASGGPVEIDRRVISRLLLLPGHRRRLPLRMACRSEAPARLRGLLEYGAPERRRVEIESGLLR